MVEQSAEDAPERSANGTKTLFVNKSLTSKFLSRSQAQEEIAIRSFIQRRNRRIGRKAKQAPTSADTTKLPDEQPGTFLQESLSNDRPPSIPQAQALMKELYEEPDQLPSAGATQRRKWTFYVPRQREGRPAHARIKPKTRQEANSTKGMTIPRSISAHFSWSRLEQRGVDYFTSLISSRFTTKESSIFWRNLLPCTAETDDAVRMLLTAIALTHECYDVLDKDPEHAKRCSYNALAYCNRAIRFIRESAGLFSSVALDITCILIVTFELLRGNHVAAKACVDAGLARSGTNRLQVVEHRWRHPVTDSVSMSADVAVEVTKAKMAMSFDVFGIRAEAFLFHEQGLALPSLPLDYLEGPPKSLSDLNRAAEVLYGIVLQITRNLTGRARIDCTSYFAHAMLRHFANFHDWVEEFRSSVKQSADAPNIFQLTQILVMKVQEALVVFNCIVIGNDEMVFDNWTSTFENMLSIIDRSLESSTPDSRRLLYHPFSAVFVPPLWLTASRCRDPCLRRRAIALLCTYRRRETHHDSLVAAKLARHIMRIEERGLDQILCCNDVPKTNRINIIAATFIEGRGMVQLKYSQAQGNGRNHVKRSEWVDWDPIGDCPPHDGNGALNGLLQIHLKYSKSEASHVDGCVYPMCYGGAMVPLACTEDSQE